MFAVCLWAVYILDLKCLPKRITALDIMNDPSCAHAWFTVAFLLKVLEERDWNSWVIPATTRHYRWVLWIRKSIILKGTQQSIELVAKLRLLNHFNKQKTKTGKHKWRPHTLIRGLLFFHIYFLALELGRTRHFEHMSTGLQIQDVSSGPESLLAIA